MYSVSSIFDSAFPVPSILIYTRFFLGKIHSKWSNGSCISWQVCRFLKCTFQNRETNWALHMTVKSWEDRCTQQRAWPSHHNLLNVKLCHLELSLKMVLEILICSLTLKPIVVCPSNFLERWLLLPIPTPHFVFKTVLEIILITWSTAVYSTFCFLSRLAQFCLYLSTI